MGKHLFIFELLLVESWSEPPWRRMVAHTHKNPKLIPTLVVEQCSFKTCEWVILKMDFMSNGAKLMKNSFQGALQRALFDQFREANAVSSARAW